VRRAPVEGEAAADAKSQSQLLRSDSWKLTPSRQKMSPTPPEIMLLFQLYRLLGLPAFSINFR